MAAANGPSQNSRVQRSTATLDKLYWLSETKRMAKKISFLTMPFGNIRISVDGGAWQDAIETLDGYNLVDPVYKSDTPEPSLVSGGGLPIPRNPVIDLKRQVSNQEAVVRELRTLVLDMARNYE